MLKPFDKCRKVEVARSAEEVFVWRAPLMEFECRLAFEFEFTSLTENVFVCIDNLTGMSYC